jgi:hypothetical protein
VHWPVMCDKSATAGRACDIKLYVAYPSLVDGHELGHEGLQVEDVLVPQPHAVLLGWDRL